MQVTRIAGLTMALAAAVFVGGCPPTTVTPTQLTTAQQAAIDDVVEQLVALAATFGVYSDLTDSQLDLSTIAQLGAFGTCPAITFAYSVTNQSALINFNFGVAPGCSSTATGGQTVTGGADVRASRTDGSGTITFLTSPVALTIDGNQVTGEMSITLTRSTAGITIVIQIDDPITVQGVGSADGSMTIEITNTGEITITTADLVFDDGTTTYTVTLANVVIDPINNGNFVPESGTATFAAGGATLAVTFGSQSPTGGSVQVSADGADAVEHVVSSLNGS